MAPSRRNARRKAPTLGQRLAGVREALRVLTRHAMTVAALLVLGAGVYLAVDALQSRSVERIVVLGKLEHLRQEAIREALGDQLDGGLVFLDLDALQSGLESLPWVYRAQLRRRFPDTLEVRVVEQLPIARWGDEAFLNHEAVLVEVVDDGRWEELPRLRGSRGSEARLMSHYQQLLERLRPLGLIPLSLEEDDMGQFWARLDNGLLLGFGARDFGLRLQRFTQLWSSELSASAMPVQQVDLRYAEGAAVRFDEPTQVVGMVTDTQDR